MQSLRLPALAALATGLLATHAHAAWVEYELEVSPDRSTVTVEATVEAFQGDALRFVLAAPPIDAETYFRFFDEVRASAPDSTALSLERQAPGLYLVSGVDSQAVHLSYRVHVRELNELAGQGHRVPVVDRDGSVLPLRALLAVPEGPTGEALPPSTVMLTVRDGERRVHVPWRIRSWPLSFSGASGTEVVRTGVVVTGDARAAKPDELGVNAYLVVRGADVAGSDAAFAQAQAIVSRLVETTAQALGTEGEEPVAVVVELRDGPPDVVGSGPFVRAQVSRATLLATRDQVAVDTPAFDFTRALAHEIFHRWIGNAGIARPGTPEVFWVSEGAAEYWALIALARTGITRPESVLEAIAARTARVAAHPERARPIDEGDGVYASDAAYREIMLLKAPLVFFLLDTELVVLERPVSSDALLKTLLIRSFMRMDREFGERDVPEIVEQLGGLPVRASIVTWVHGPLHDAVRARAGVVGIEWAEGGAGAKPRFAEGSEYLARIDATR